MKKNNWKRWIAKMSVMFICIVITQALCGAFKQEFSILVFICGGVASLVYDAVGRFMGDGESVIVMRDDG